MTNPYRLLPSVEDVLSSDYVDALTARVGRGLVSDFVVDVLDRWRAEIKAGELDADGVQERLERGDLKGSLEKRVEREEKAGLVHVVNAAGVVLHTGLGRAPVHPEVAAAMEQTARRYGTLEVDRFSGQRNKRDDRIAELLCRLTGAEAAIAVNNNAAAVLLLLNTFAAGKETIVSRGELVEIGGSFRMPAVMERAGTKLVEVGTTNRTRAVDFTEATTAATGLILKVHTSNYRIVGFTEETDTHQLGALGKELGVTTAFDLGSGLIESEDALPLDALSDEPLVKEAVESGVDVVCFSGDKLFGGPQSGMLVGSVAAIDALRANPMYRALRLDKVTIAGLERTLALYVDGRGDEIPARAMLRRSADDLRPLADAIAAELTKLDGVSAEVVADASQPGSGSAPDVFLPTFVVRVSADSMSADALAVALRHGDPPVFARIKDDRLVLDPRTLLEGDRERLLAAFRGVFASD